MKDKKGMSLISKLVSKIRYIVRKSAEGLHLSPIYSLGSFFSGNKPTQAKLMQEAVNWVFACISRISESVISEDWKLYKKTGKSPDDWTEVDNSPFLDLMHRPNSWMTGSDLVQMWSQHEDLTGNAYWLFDGVTDEKSMPTAIYPLNPAHMTVKIGFIPGQPDGIVGYEFMSGASKKTFKPYEILHFRRTNPNDLYRGMGPTEASMSSVDTDNWMREWNRRFFQNSAIPGVILETEESSPEAIRLLRESFEDRHGGVERAHKTIALPKGVKLAERGYAQKDLDFVESRAKNRDEILAAFGVPPIVLGMGLGESINRATAETQEYVYAKYTIRPKLRRFEECINEFLLSRFGDDLVIEFDDPVPQNTEQNLAMYSAALGGNPYMTINEVRAREGLDPIKNGDMVMGSVIQQPIGSPIKGGQPRPTSQAPVARSKRIKRLSSTSKARQDIKQAKGAIEEGVLRGLVSVNKKRIKELSTIDWAENWKAFVDRTTPEEKRMKDFMAEYAKDMAARAEAAVRQELKGVDIETILSRDDEIAIIVDGMKPIYLDILFKEGMAAAALVGAAFDDTDKRILKALEKSIKLMARSYTDETLAVLKQKLGEGLAEGEGIAALAERVQEVGVWAETTRAERVARTEAFRTANFATQEAWKQSGVVKSKKWYTAEDERVCDSCSVLDGEVVGIDETFADKGDSIGDIVISYADIEAGSLHPNCRCMIRPEDIEIPE